MINGYVGPTLSIEDMHGIFYLRYKKQGDSKSSREVGRLMQLGFLGSFRWGPITSTKHFEILDTADARRMKRLKGKRFIRDGVIQIMYEEHLDPLKQQLVDAMK